jgi:hypothetical protein
MSNASNPYASPQTAGVHPAAAGRKQERTSWGDRVAAGLLLVCLGTVLGLALLLLQICASVMAWYGLVIVVTWIAGLASLGFTVVGTLLCLAAPKRKGSHLFIYASTAAGTGAAVVYLAGLLGLGGVTLSASLGLLQAIAEISFLLFVLRLAQAVDRRDLATFAGIIILLCLVVVGITTLVLAIAVGVIIAARHDPTVEGVIVIVRPLFLISTVLKVIALTMYANLLYRTRQAIR